MLTSISFLAPIDHSLERVLLREPHLAKDLLNPLLSMSAPLYKYCLQIANYAQSLHQIILCSALPLQEHFYISLLLLTIESSKSALQGFARIEPANPCKYQLLVRRISMSPLLFCVLKDVR